MATINPILNSVAQTVYANMAGTDQKPENKQVERQLEREPPKTTASGNTTVTLSEAGLQQLYADQTLSAQQSVQEKESLESSAQENERNEMAAGLANGSQVNQRA